MFYAGRFLAYARVDFGWVPNVPTVDSRLVWSHLNNCQHGGGRLELGNVPIDVDLRVVGGISPIWYGRVGYRVMYQ